MEKNTSLVKAINKNVRTSPRKLALVCNFIKGKKVDIALRDLEFSRKRIAKDVSKTVKSAISNAENNYQWKHLFIWLTPIQIMGTISDSCLYFAV